MMENQMNRNQDEAIIDLKELFFYILRKWKVLIFAGILGVVLGACVSMLLPEKTIDDLEIDELNLEEIGQYARYQQLYDEQIEREAASVLINMDPHQVYYGTKIYYITAYESDMNRISEGYSTITSDPETFNELALASGLGCTEDEIRDLVSIWFGRYDKGEIDPLFGNLERSARINISIKAPTEEAYVSMLEYLDARVQAVSQELAQNLEGFGYELVSEVGGVGYEESVAAARSQSAELIESYLSKISTLEKTLTDDDLLYYKLVYAPEQEEEEEEEGIGFGWLKWGIVVGVLFGGMMVAFYGVLFLLDGHVKTEEELLERYGLYRIASLSAKEDAQENGYVLQFLKMTGLTKVQLCADESNPVIVGRAEKLARQSDTIVLCKPVSADEQALKVAEETEGAVLFVHLWKTTHTALARELEVLARIGQKVLGVIVIR